MAIRGYDIGGMLARAGESQGQQIASGFQQFGQGLGGLFSGVTAGLQKRQERKEREETAQEVQQLLQQYANNPAQLNALGQKYASEGNNEMAKLFFDAAKTATSKQVASLEQQSETISREAARKRTEAQKKAAIRVAESKGDTNAIEGLTSGAIDPIEYFKTKKEGSKAALKTYKTKILEDGQEVEYIISTDPQTGEEVNRVKTGVVPSDKKDKEGIGRGDWSVTEGEQYTQTVNDQRKASEESRKYSSLLQETISIAGESGQVGGILGTARDFVIADVAGLGDAITVHRSRLNEVRMQNAIALLPRGPASDRDVRLALDASVDPKNLNAEDRVAYIRGMKKISDAEKEYMDGKLRWIEQTGDALAFGYERKVSLDGMTKQVEAFRTDNATEVAVLEGELKKVRALANAGNKGQAKELLDYIKSIDSIGYLSLLEEQEAEQQRYDNFIEQNNINFF